MKKLSVSLFISLLISNFSYSFTKDFKTQNLTREIEEAFSKGDISEEMLKVPSGLSTSIKLKFKYKGQNFEVVPECSATVILGEVLAWNASRALGFNEIVSAKSVIEIRGKGLKILRNKFSQAINITKSKPRENARRAEKYFNKAISSGDVVYMALAQTNLPSAPVSAKGMLGNGGYNTSHPLVKSVMGKNVQDYEIEERLNSYGEFVDSELITKDFANFLIVDTLLNGWDRFSGSNITFSKTPRGLRMGAYDNGGTFQVSGKGWPNKHMKYIYRIDKMVYDRIIELNSFLNHGGAHFQGISSESELRKVLDFEKSHWSLVPYWDSSFSMKRNIADKYWSTFKKNLNNLASTLHSRSHSKNFFIGTTETNNESPKRPILRAIPINQ